MKTIQAKHVAAAPKPLHTLAPLMHQAPNNAPIEQFNVDLYNTFDLIFSGVNLTSYESQHSKNEDVYNAAAFFNANPDVTLQLVGHSAEWQLFVNNAGHM